MHLPPQAYTKETLIQAYNWLRTQPTHIQELAKSPDALVSLYTKSQIHGESYLNRTNLQGFKSELKNLANLMGDLDHSTDDPPGAITKSPTSSNKTLNSTASPTAAVNMASSLNPHNGAHSSSPSVASHSSSPHSPQGTNSLNNSGIGGPRNTNSSLPPMITESTYPLFNALIANQTQEMQDLRTLLDARSWGMLQEVKNHLNLSSETEALRLLISLGYQKIRPQF